MSTAAGQKAFRVALQERKFASAYYFHGEEEHLKDDAIRALIEVAVDPATRDFNLERCKGGEMDAETLGSLLGTPPMMADRRVVIIRDVGALRKDTRAELDRYLKAPAADILLVLVSSGEGKPDKQLTDTTTVVEFTALTGMQLPKWIARHAELLGGKITEPAATLLQDIVGNDLAQLAVELEKLTSHAPEGVISEEAVSAVVGVRREETLGHLLDAIAAKDSATALHVLPIALQQPKASAVTTVMALAVQTLALAWGQARGLPPARLSGEYFTLLKEAGSTFTGRAWGEAVSTWTKNAARWSPNDLDHALEALAQADRTLKETRLSSDEQVLATLILTLCGVPGHRSAA